MKKHFEQSRTTSARRKKKYLQNRDRKCIGKVRKIVSCRFCSYFPNIVVALWIVSDYRINQQKLSVRSLPLSIIYAFFVVYDIWHNWYNYIIYSPNNIPNNIPNNNNTSDLTILKSPIAKRNEILQLMTSTRVDIRLSHTYLLIHTTYRYIRR